MICAPARIAPIMDHLLFEAQPPSKMPITPNPLTAVTKSTPMFRSAICAQGAKGTTTRINNGTASAKNGASRCIGLSAFSGTMSSLRKSLIVSATVCRRP
jgi:hypothetical protein